MGLFDDFDIDMDEVKAAGGFDFDDGNYDFTISEALIQNGTKNDPDDTKFIIKYDLDEAGTYWEWFTVAVDGDPSHPKAKQSLGYLKGRLVDLGFDAADLNDIGPDDLEGIVGTLALKTTSGKGKNAANKYQNVRDVKVAVDEPEPEPAKPARRRAAAKPAPAEEPAEAPEEDEDEKELAAIKARVAAKQAARAAAPAAEKKAPVRRRAAAAPAADDADDENPFG